jgi:TraB/PrgY/gumN family
LAATKKPPRKKISILSMAVGASLFFSFQCYADPSPESSSYFEVSKEGFLFYVVPSLHYFYLESGDRKAFLKYRRFLNGLMLTKPKQIYFERRYDRIRGKDAIASEKTMPESALLTELSLKLSNTRLIELLADERLNFGTEFEVQLLNQSHGIKVNGLESAHVLQAEFAKLSRLTSAQGSQPFDLSNDLLFKKNLRELTLQLFAGDTKRVCKSLVQLSNINSEYWQNIVTIRNKAWAKTIAKNPDNFEKTMIVVAIGHFCGQDNFISQLTKLGFNAKAIAQ